MNTTFIITFIAGLLHQQLQINQLQHLNYELEAASGDHQGRSGFMMDPWDDFDREHYDSLYFAFESIIDSLSPAVLFEMDQVFSPDSSYAGVWRSDDRMLKIFQWEYINGGSMQETMGIRLLKTPDGRMAAVSLDYYVDELYTLDSTQGIYLTHSYDQGCSTCFREVMESIHNGDHEAGFYLETEDYRHSYFHGGAIQYDTKNKVITLIYDDIILEDEAYGEEMDKEEKKAMNECYYFVEGRFEKIDCDKAQYDRYEHGW